MELYNQLPQSTLFYQILSNHAVVAVINTLLGKRENENLYINSMSVRMDPPGKSPYILGWHRDDNSNILNSNFIQFWRYWVIHGLGYEATYNIPDYKSADLQSASELLTAMRIDDFFSDCALGLIIVGVMMVNLMGRANS